MKKDSDSTFDVTMGSYDGAEVCELVGIYILSILKEKYGESQIGLYRHDGLEAFHDLSKRVAGRTRKEITKIFNTLGLQITIQANLKEVNFLDVTFDLRTGTYQPYRKPNDHPLYINTSSNQQPNIIRQLPSNIGKRISEISSSEEIFDRAATYYNNALKASRYKEKVRYETETTNNHTSAKRKRKLIWFNPPFSMNVKTNIAKNFLQLIDKHFPPEHKLHKIFNRNSVKVSYSCMPNASSIIKSHKKKILESQPESRTPKCKCRDQDTCPLGGECLIDNVVYLAEVTNNKNSERKSYIGLTALTFKDRLYKHQNSLRYRTKANNTELSKYVWSLRDKNIDAEICWSILDKAPP